MQNPRSRRSTPEIIRGKEVGFSGNLKITGIRRYDELFGVSLSER